MSATTTATSETPAVPVETGQSLRDILQVKSPSQVVDWINFLVYGDPGVGKTWLCGTAMDHPDTGPVLYLDVDGGVTTLRHRSTLDTKAVRAVNDPNKESPGFNQIYQSLVDSITLDSEGIPRLEYYKTIVIDRLDELSDVDMRNIMREAYNRNPDKVDIDVPSPREYGINRSHIRKLVRAFRDLPCHVIFVCGAGMQQEEGQPSKIFPGFTGKLKSEVSGFCDIVGYYYNDTSTGELVRKIQFQGTKRIQAKDRTGSLGGLLDNPTIPMMWNLINPTSPNGTKATK